MVTVPKPIPVMGQGSAATARLGPPTRVASVNQGVDELQTNQGVSFDAAAFGFREEDRPTFNRGGGRGSHQHHPGLVNATTQAFAAMLENNEPVTTSDAGGDVRGPQFTGVRAKAIESYEETAAVISGNINVLGTSVSLVL